MRLSADRLTAARLLLRIEGGAFSSRLLAGGSAPGIRIRVIEVLRWLRALDVVIQRWCRVEMDRLDPEVRIALRIGLVEVMRMDVPPALATDGSVRLVRRLGRSSASGMVNAVLRKAAMGWRDVLNESAIDVQLSHPWWLYQRWFENFGSSGAEGSMAASQEAAITWVWFYDDESRQSFDARGIGLEPHPWMPDSYTAPGKAPELVQEVRGGKAYAQDPSSQLVAHLAGSLTPEGACAIDLCAAPGGKIARMSFSGGTGWRLAADVSLRRTQMMAETLKRLGDIPVVVADVLDPPFAREKWDLVLLDAPCTGSGTLRRHPELKWRLAPTSIEELAAKQSALVESAMTLVAPGGLLLYSTCSIEPEENEDLVSHLPSGFEIEDLSSRMPDGTPWIPTRVGGCRILPNPYGDGFTMHAVRRLQ